MNVDKPKQKFKINDIVSCKWKGTYRIYDVPQWNNWSRKDGYMPQWLYPIEYGLGGTSEGFGMEIDLSLKK
jgi:hypothetical protein